MLLICLSCKFLNHGNRPHVEEARTVVALFGGGKKVWTMNSSVDFLSFPLSAQFEE